MKWSAEKLETLPAGTKPRTSHHWSPGGERLWKRKRSNGSSDWQWLSLVLSRKIVYIFLERMREGHRQSDEHWNCFKGNVGETSEGGAHMGFAKRIDTILNWNECRKKRKKNPNWWFGIGNVLNLRRIKNIFSPYLYLSWTHTNHLNCICTVLHTHSGARPFNHCPCARYHWGGA